MMSKTKKTDKKNPPKVAEHYKTGLDEWNDRLDENCENEHEGNELADEKARDYSYKAGSGDQSDETIDIQK
jgi:cyclopropane fatty-acyl-phospholipid synthase-like methyltransferase